MTPDEMTHAPGHCGEDVAAYALGALDPTEADAFRRHLDRCAVCPDELASFQHVVDDLAASTPSVPAPRSLRRRVMRDVAQTPRLDPEARHERRRLRLRLPRPAPALSAGLAVVVAAVVVAAFALSSGSSSRVVTAQVTGQGTASLHLSGGHGELVVHHLPAPPPGKIYEVWLKRGSAAPAPAHALFSVSGGAVDVPGSLHGVSQVLVTPEPAGGSRHPTHQPVISARLD